MKEGTVVPSRNIRIQHKSNRKIDEIQNRSSKAPKFNPLSWEIDCQEQFTPISTRPKQKNFFLSVLSI
jgi:hypothetical protein